MNERRAALSLISVAGVIAASAAFDQRAGGIVVSSLLWIIASAIAAFAACLLIEASGLSQPSEERGAGARRVARSLLSVLAGLAIACALIQASGYNALSALSALWTGASGLQSGPAIGPADIAIGAGHLDTFQLAQSLAKVTPLLLCGLCVGLGLRAGLFNIGAQGQMTVGALAAAAVGLSGATGSPTAPQWLHLEWLRLMHLFYGDWASSWPPGPVLPAFVHVPMMIAAGTLAGGLWGALAGLLKAWRGVHEVISTIMLNFVAIDLATYLVKHSLRDPQSQNLQTSRIADSALLPPIVPHSNLTIGLALALCAAIATAFLIARTSPGFAIRAVGLNAEAAEAAGISTARTLVLAMGLSGGLAGIAGAVEVMGVHHRYVDGLAGTYGFDGIAVALLAGLDGGGAILSALFFGLLASGSNTMESLTSVPAPISSVVQAIVIMFVGIRYVGGWRKPSRSDSPAVPPTAAGSSEGEPNSLGAQGAGSPERSQSPHAG